MADDVARVGIKKRAMWRHMRPSRVAHVYECASARVCVCAHVCACVCNEGESTMLRIFANSLITHTLYTHIFSLISAMWNYVFVF